MSVREEDRQRNCPSRGLGIAAAAIGVGVGAALYYFFNKRSENPDGEGSTSDWSYEQPHTLRLREEDDSYTTISENSTSDTSMHDDSHESNYDMSLTETDTNSSGSDSNMSSSNDSDPTDSEMSVESNSSPSWLIPELTTDVAEEMDNLQRDLTQFFESDEDWDVTTSSVDLPSDDRFVSPIRAVFNRLIALRDAHINRPQAAVTQEAILREQAFRNRTWTAEECSICFDVMLQTQEVMSLPCTHRFHQPCILPWLQEKQTCPNCRKVA